MKEADVFTMLLTIRFDMMLNRAYMCSTSALFDQGWFYFIALP